MAFARVKTYWVKMKAIDVASRSPLKGKNHHAPEHYFEDVLEGARLIEGQCSKDMIFEWNVLNCKRQYDDNIMIFA